MTRRRWHRALLALAAAGILAACTPAGQQATGPTPGGPGGGAGAGGGSGGGGSGGGGSGGSTPPTTGVAALSWTPPAQYIDGNALPPTELAAYRIYYGNSPASLARIAEVDGGTTTFAVRGLATGRHYFAVTAVSVSGGESSFSAVGSKAVP